MRFDWSCGSPSIDDEINSAPKRQVAVMVRNDVREQSHPERGQRFVINIHSMMRGKAQERSSHSRGCFRQRHLREIAQRYRQVRRVRKLRWCDRRRFECCDESMDFCVAREITRLQVGSGIKFLPRFCVRSLRRLGNSRARSTSTRAGDSLRQWRDIRRAAD